MATFRLSYRMLESDYRCRPFLLIILVLNRETKMKVNFQTENQTYVGTKYRTLLVLKGIFTQLTQT